MSKIEALRATNREYSDGFGPRTANQQRLVMDRFAAIVLIRQENSDVSNRCIAAHRHPVGSFRLIEDVAEPLGQQQCTTS